MKGYLKKVTSFALAVGMLFSAVTTTFVSSSAVTAANIEVAAEEIHIWDGTTDVSWYDDEETEFHISTAEQLAGFAAIVNTGKTMEGKTFILDNDIYLNDVSAYDEWDITKPANTWTPVKVFSGTFQGDNHSIIGLYTTDGGMFSEVVNGCISELNLIDLYVSGYYDRNKKYCCGGMTAYSDNSSVINCSVQGKINNTDSGYTSGFVGHSESSKIIGCTNMAEVSGSNSFVGGICGSATSTSCIVNCINKGNIKGYESSGGICGILKLNALITNCVNYGDVYGDNDTGGICGRYFDGKILNSYGKILNSYNAGKVTSNCHPSGICHDGVIINVYNTGEIINGYAISCLGTVSNAYYLSGTALKDGANTIAKTEANMKKESFADSLGEAFYYVEGEYPKLAFEVGRTISNFDKTSLAFKEFGETQTLTLDTTYLGEPEWVSSDTSVATVDSDGVVTAVGNGTAMIYALCSDSKAVCSVTVGYDYYLSDNELSLKKGRVHDLSVFSSSTGKEVTDIDVEWSSSDDSIVSVDSEGMITTSAVGTAAITAKIADIELSCIVSVYEYQVPAVIVPDDENAPKLSETDFTISTIDSKLLSVKNYNDSITWVSANTSIAEVSKNGLVKGVSEGDTAIYALLADGRCLKANAVIIKSEYTMGDVNLDGKFNVSDVVLLQKWLLAIPDTKLKYWENADFYEDGILNVFDLCLMKKELIAQSK